jgi:hypothetical protein
MWDCGFGVCHARWHDYPELCMGANPYKAELSPLSDCEMQEEGKSQRHQVWGNLMTCLWAEMPSTGIWKALRVKDSSILSFRTQGLNSGINVNELQSGLFPRSLSEFQANQFLAFCLCEIEAEKSGETTGLQNCTKKTCINSTLSLL